ncbi:DUF2254 domain-containing protein [Pusillimonas sp. ANT_WB101]|uniref:DUF2254 domain-containing protein n=1 Tax=Pusillimonas sp. ANT_WB101 TaxID=2597356 RepID=UPI0011EC6752|nr:DUF2254 domain-containing protein [Pusillimonas sp. ANT_WB101]KAA0892860.1 DUF2254 domain-containing protein [Pusillimonas sp. ANT_WB101]
MTAQLRKFLNQLGDTFWLVPGVMVLGGILLALGLLAVDRQDILPTWLIENNWLYNGGGTGARTLLGAIASSTIGVAGTVFSITIAALSLAAGQMGPRLLRNFTQDRGVQLTLGVYLGTFSYALMVLRSVRTQEEGAFTPHLALSVGIIFAFICVAILVYFVSHMANRINVDTVVELVSDDIRWAMDRLVTDQAQATAPDASFWANATPIVDARRGYLQQLSEEELAGWAAEQGTAIRLLVRRGDYVFPGAPIAVMTVQVPDAEAAVRRATALGLTRGSAGDAEYAVRQLVEVAVRALSPGINDPHTAMSVLDRLGAALCELAGKNLPSGVTLHEEQVALVVPNFTYESLVDVMFNMIRQNAAGSTAVLIRMLDVLTAVVACEADVPRRAVLMRHANLVWTDAQRTILNLSDRDDVGQRFALFMRTMAHGALGAINARPLSQPALQESPATSHNRAAP